MDEIEDVVPLKGLPHFFRLAERYASLALADTLNCSVHEASTCPMAPYIIRLPDGFQVSLAGFCRGEKFAIQCTVSAQVAEDPNAIREVRDADGKVLFSADEKWVREEIEGIPLLKTYAVTEILVSLEEGEPNTYSADDVALLEAIPF